MNPIRVHFGPMPQLLRTIVSDLLCSEPDIEIVGYSYERDVCLKDVRERQAAVVIAQDSADDGSSCLDLILADPPFGILALSNDGRRASGVSLARWPITLEPGSPAILADAIRRVASALGRAEGEDDPPATPIDHATYPEGSGGGSS